MPSMGAAATRCALAISLCVAGWLASVAHPALADVPTGEDSTPTVGVVVVTPDLPTPAPTLEMPTPVIPPTITREHSKPVATAVVAIPVVTEPPPTSPGLDIRPTATPVVPPTPAAGAVGTTLPAVVVPQAPELSPQELRQNARLRWGKGIPADVKRWAFLIVPAARRYNLSPNLIAAVMTMESGGDPIAWSHSDARGLMQILHGPWDPRENVDKGAKMLAALHDQFGDWDLVLAAYNAGPNAVMQYGGVPPYRETRDYVIVVGYLWDLYSHKHISLHRKTQYRHTLQDLSHFAKERKKIARLAHAAQVDSARLLACGGQTCDRTGTLQVAPSLDPFWPMTEVPDPLQKVEPGTGQ